MDFGINHPKIDGSLDQLNSRTKKRGEEFKRNMIEFLENASRDDLRKNKLLKGDKRVIGWFGHTVGDPDLQLTATYVCDFQNNTVVFYNIEFTQIGL